MAEVVKKRSSLSSKALENYGAINFSDMGGLS